MGKGIHAGIQKSERNYQSPAEYSLHHTNKYSKIKNFLFQRDIYFQMIKSHLRYEKHKKKNESGQKLYK